MIFGVSLKFLQRSKRKTILLCCLLMLITIFSILGVSMYDNSVKLLEEADKTYTTMGVIEYVGGAYPDNTKMDAIGDEQIRNFSYDTIEKREEIKRIHKEHLMLGYVEGAKLGEYFDPPFANYSVICFKVMYIMEDGMYRCVLTDSLYSSTGGEGTTFGLSKETLSNIEEYNLENDHFYIACGDFRMEDGLLVFSPTDKTGIVEEYDPSKHIADYPFTDITDRPEYLIQDPEMEYWNQLIEFYTVQNASFQVTATEELDTQTDYYLGAAQMKEGRNWTDSEYDEGKKVCVIHTAIASNLGKTVGDTLTVSLHYTEDTTNFYGSYSSSAGFSETVDYEIIGIYTENSDGAGPQIYVPATSVENLPKQQSLYNICNVILENGTTETFEEATDELFVEGFRMTIYDQGYSQTVAPIKAMRNNAVIIMTLCGVCDLVVLFLFATLHITKQYDVVAVMTSMGTGRKNIRQFLLGGARVIGGIGCVLGGIIGYIASFAVIRIAYQSAVDTHTKDLRYSNLNMGLQKAFEAKIQGSIPVALIVTVLLFLGVLLLCSVYSNNVITAAENFGGQKKRKKKAKKEDTLVTAAAVPKETFQYREIPVEKKRYGSLGRLKFIFKQAIRGGKRNLRVNLLLFLIPMAIAIFMIIFTNTIENYKVSLKSCYERFEVDAYFTTFTGKPLNVWSNLPEEIKEYLELSPYVDQTYYSGSFNYEIVGKLEGEPDTDEYNESKAELDTIATEMFATPTTSFAVERREQEIFNAPELIAVDDISRSKEFFGATPPIIEFLPGYEKKFVVGDSDFINQREDYNYGEVIWEGVVPEEVMKEYELELGDYLYIGELAVYYNESGGVAYMEQEPVVIYVVGSYQSLNGSNSIYIPMMESFTFGDYMNMRLTNTDKLSKFRDDMEEMGVANVGYSGTSRVSMIIEDKELVQAVDTIQNNISFMTTLGYALIGVVMVIGFVASFLSMRTRREEVAIIRSMGAGKVRTFAMFFIEQLIIGVFGTLAGILAAFIYTGEITIMEMGIAFLFFLCFMFGSGICIGKMNRKNVLSILSATD